jgi:hypothetical protein
VSLFPNSDCHSPNFRIAGSNDIRAVIDSRQRHNCAGALYVAVRDAICHGQFTGQVASKAKSSGRSDLSWSPRSRESMSPLPQAARGQRRLPGSQIRSRRSDPVARKLESSSAAQ